MLDDKKSIIFETMLIIQDIRKKATDTNGQVSPDILRSEYDRQFPPKRARKITGDKNNERGGKSDERGGKSDGNGKKSDERGGKVMEMRKERVMKEEGKVM